MSDEFKQKISNVTSTIDGYMSVFMSPKLTIAGAVAFAILYLSLFGGAFWLSHIATAPDTFPVGRVVTVPEGMGSLQVGRTLQEAGVIRSPKLFAIMVRNHSGQDRVLSGDYFFEHAAPVSVIASRVSRGAFGLTPTRVVIPEGATVADIAGIMAKRFPKFDPDAFLAAATDMEGYLFPDTYLFLPNIDEVQVIEEMRSTFDSRVAEIADSIEASGKPLEELVTMASIIEKEAWKYDDRRIISGVLWNRLDIGMPLQVDATFLYINGKNTYELTYDDLKDESPYNTYVYKGLPPGPIASPSLDALEAAAVPAETDYLFYLADRQGNTYFSRTYDEHRSYKAIYID
jgi:UPF0755 protein